MKRLLILPMIVLASCQILGVGDAGDAQSDGTGSSGGVIQWDRSPTAVVFRADVGGGEFEDAFFLRNDVPPCTVYGDNRVVWTAQPFESSDQILWDRLSDEDIENFVSELTVARLFFTYSSGADLEPASETSPVVETLTLSVNEGTHTSDAFGDWPERYYEELLQLCQTISDTPVIYEPAAAWVAVQPAQYDPNVSELTWDGEVSGLDLAELAASEEPLWITDRNVKVLWNMIRAAPPDILFSQAGDYYQVALQVPGVTRDAPPAPSE